MNLDIGGVIAEVADETVRLSGDTFKGGNQEGDALAYTVRVPDGAILEIASTRWDNAERDVRTITRLSGSIAFDRLLSGCRLGVGQTDQGLYYCELGITSFHEDKQPTVVKASEEDLNSVLGSDYKAMLMSFGAVAVGTREAVMDETNRRRSYLAVTFAPDTLHMPLVSYVLTRVLPLMRGFGRNGAIPVGQA